MKHFLKCEICAARITTEQTTDWRDSVIDGYAICEYCNKTLCHECMVYAGDAGRHLACEECEQKHYYEIYYWVDNPNKQEDAL